MSAVVSANVISRDSAQDAYLPPSLTNEVTEDDKFRDSNIHLQLQLAKIEIAALALAGKLEQLVESSLDGKVEVRVGDLVIESAELYQSPAEESVRTVTADLSVIKKAQVKTFDSPYTVPFFSQFTDISSPQWQKVGCGIASVAMLIDYYEPDIVSVETLLADGIASGYFLTDAGWTHAGLINLAKPFGLIGRSVSLADLTMDLAFDSLTTVLKDGPVMVSVHYTFEPSNPIPHLVVVNGVKDGLVYYNDPAEASGGGSISVSQFKSAWKKRYIAIRPGS